MCWINQRILLKKIVDFFLLQIDLFSSSSWETKKHFPWNVSAKEISSPHFYPHFPDNGFFGFFLRKKDWNWPVIHLSENCLWFFSEDLWRVYYKDFTLSRDKAAAGNDVREQNEEAVRPFNPAGWGKMGFECHYSQTIQSFTTVNNKAKFGVTQLDASKSSRHWGDTARSVPIVYVLACYYRQTVSVCHRTWTRQTQSDTWWDFTQRGLCWSHRLSALATFTRMKNGFPYYHCTVCM